MGRVSPNDAKQYIGKVCEVEWLDHSAIDIKHDAEKAKPFLMKTLGRIQNVKSHVVAGFEYYYLIVVHEEQEYLGDQEKSFETTVIMLADVTWFQPYEVA